MPLSRAFLDELQLELKGLHQLKVKIDERIRAIEAFMVPLDLGQVALPFLQGDNGHNAEHQPVQSRDATAGSSANNGLRKAILDTLRHNGPNRAPEVAKILKTKGFTNDSATPLSTRVYNDLWRMSKAGIVAGKNGVFGLK